MSISFDELQQWHAGRTLANLGVPLTGSEDGIWVRAQMDRLDPAQRAGWKLHLSSTPTALPSLLERVAPFLREGRFPFKVAATAEVLERLNDGCFGLTQVGKAVTLYPPDEPTAARVAAQLADLLQGWPGPPVVSDEAFRKGAPVYFRFGAFDARFTYDALGQAHRLVAHPELGDVEEGAPPPARTCLPVTEPADHLAFLREEFLFARVLQLSAKGGTFIALRKKLDAAQVCVVKTARAGAHSDLLGRDAIGALRREHAFLQRLAGLPGVPGAGELRCDGCDGEETAALIRPYLEGERWWDLWTRPDARSLPVRQQALRLLKRLAALVQACHARGVLLRDLSPGNILFAGDAVYMIDFELAHDVADASPGYRRGTSGFYDPHRDRFASPTPGDDAYALLALAFMSHTGGHPAWLQDGLRDWAEGTVPLPAAPEFGEAWRTAYAVREDAAMFFPAFERLAEAHAVPPVLPGLFSQKDDAAFWEAVHSGLRRYRGADGEPARLNVYSGVAGLILCAAERDAARLQTLLPENDWQRSLVSMAEQARRLAHIPGLYFGAAGVAAALWTLAPAVDTETQALELFETVMEQSDGSRVPDLCHGWAGFAAALCAANTFEPHPRLRSLAASTADRLLELAVSDDSGGAVWPWPEGPFGTMSGARLYGFGHGVAGVAHTLLALYDWLGDGRLREAARAGLETLCHAARPLEDGAVWWPCSEQDTTAWNAWCHGTPGVSKAFARALRTEENKGYRNMLAGALRGIALANNSGWCLCHGVASRVDAYADALATLPAASMPALAADHALLASLDVYKLERLQCTGEAGAESGGFMTGAVGVSRALWRLENPARGWLP